MHRVRAFVTSSASHPRHTRQYWQEKFVGCEMKWHISEFNLYCNLNRALLVHLRFESHLWCKSFANEILIFCVAVALIWATCLLKAILTRNLQSFWYQILLGYLGIGNLKLKMTLLKGKVFEIALSLKCRIINYNTKKKLFIPFRIYKLKFWVSRDRSNKSERIRSWYSWIK